MRPAWAKGHNYDPAHLTMYTANPGFIIGESLLGVDPLGGAGADTPIDARFTSITITSPTTVEDGLFVHREVETCNLSATLPEKIDLRNQWIIIKYFGTEIFRGRVGEPQLVESVEVGAEYKPGNTATKTYRLSLTATNGEDVLATMSTPARTFTTATLAQRIASWTGLSVTTQSPAADMPVGWANAGWDTATVRKIYRGTDQLGSLLDTLRNEAKLRNMTFLYQPLKSPQFVLKPNNQWLTGTGATALCFTDDPAHMLGQVTDPGDQYVHLGRYVGYTSRSVGLDSSLFRTAVSIRWGQYDVESPPADGQPVETMYGPYKASGAATADAVVDLGTLDVASPSSNPYWLSRAVAATLPLKATLTPFTTSVTTPFQSMQQLAGTVPGMALLEHDGIVERVAVLGRSHSITPEKWTVAYTLGPPHLLDRSSDFDPGTPIVHAPAPGSGGVLTVLEWVVPNYPSDATIYEAVYANPTAIVPITSDNALLISADVTKALPPGTVRQINWFTPGPANTFWVLYTSNPTPGTSNPSALWREGQPAYLGDAL
ncbi:hypothetical protein ABZX12_18620 [Kribbella sp. NPDC003505]|uniref:hypothetical protein n=1 Tax=Kribbella sp. NPDC003505 TaxID=3154448 RepID=UPI0033A40BC7